MLSVVVKKLKATVFWFKLRFKAENFNKVFFYSLIVFFFKKERAKGMVDRHHDKRAQLARGRPNAGEGLHQGSISSRNNQREPMETRGEGRARAARLAARAETPKSSAQTQLGNLPPSREDSTQQIQCPVAESLRSMDRG